MSGFYQVRRVPVKTVRGNSQGGVRFITAVLTCRCSLQDHGLGKGMEEDVLRSAALLPACWRTGDRAAAAVH